MSVGEEVSELVDGDVTANGKNSEGFYNVEELFGLEMSRGFERGVKYYECEFLRQ